MTRPTRSPRLPQKGRRSKRSLQAYPRLRQSRHTAIPFRSAERQQRKSCGIRFRPANPAARTPEYSGERRCPLWVNRTTAIEHLISDGCGPKLAIKESESNGSFVRTTDLQHAKALYWVANVGFAEAASRQAMIRAKSATFLGSGRFPVLLPWLDTL